MLIAQLVRLVAGLVTEPDGVLGLVVERGSAFVRVPRDRVGDLLSGGFLRLGLEGGSDRVSGAFDVVTSLFRETFLAIGLQRRGSLVSRRLTSGVRHCDTS